MSENNIKTVDLTGQRLTEILAEDQGGHRVRISHAQGTPLVGEGRTQTSQAFESWSPDQRLCDVQVAPDDDVFGREARKLCEDIKTHQGHRVELRTSYVLEYQPKPQVFEPPQEEDVPIDREPGAPKMRAIARSVPRAEPEASSSWTVMLLGIVGPLILAWLLWGHL